jgi:uncharacterized cupin superfamily protein
MRSIFLTVAIVLAGTGCAYDAHDAHDAYDAYDAYDVGGADVGTQSSALQLSDIIVYRSGRPVPQSDLTPLDPVGFGSHVMQGNVQMSARLDVLDSGTMGGVFQATSGTYSVLYPTAMHSTILAGDVHVTFQGQSYDLQEGDSYLVTQGSEVVFTTTGAMHQESFLRSNVNASSEPSFMAYRRGQTATSDDLVPIDTSAYDVTILKGPYESSARFDYLTDAEIGAVVQTNRSEVIEAGGAAVWYSTVLRHSETLIDNCGVRHLLRQGDSYIVPPNTPVHWKVNGPFIQEVVFVVLLPVE